MQQSEEQKDGGSKEEVPTEATNIALVPKFLSGLKTDVTNNIFFTTDDVVVYPCGHNIIMHNTENGQQKYLPGIEGSTGIKAMALSRNKRFLAVAEATEKTPICIVYDLHHLDAKTEKQKRRIIAQTESTARYYCSVAFCPSNESLLATLTEPGETPANYAQQEVSIWLWDKQKSVIKQVIQITSTSFANQISFNPNDENAILVTGQKIYNFYKKTDNNLKLDRSQLGKKDSNISQNYTAHCWLPDFRILIGTDQGDIIIAEGDGTFKMNLFQEHPIDGFYINSLKTYMKGFLVGGNRGQIMIFDKTENPSVPYQRVAVLPVPQQEKEKSEKEKNPKQKALEIMMKHLGTMNVRCMDLNKLEDNLIFSTDKNQLFKVKVNLERPTEGTEYDYLVTNFHSGGINGIDLCIRKSIVATCGTDKTVKIWSYNDEHVFKLEFSQEFVDDKQNTVKGGQQEPDEPLSVAFHPSGFQLVVGFNEKIRMMNLFQDSLKEYKAIQIKTCRDIQFSNGGQLFACQNGSFINVFKFFTAENPAHYVFKAHTGPVRRISWLDDDSGFVSCGWDQCVYLWKLALAKNQNESQKSVTNDDKTKQLSNPVWEYRLKNVDFTCVKTYREQGQENPSFYITGSDKSLREFSGPENAIKERYRLEQQQALSDLAIMRKRQAIFVGLNESSKPGSIQVVKYPSFDITATYQTHSQPVAAIKLSYDNTTLFSTSSDGTLCMFKIVRLDKMKNQVREKELIPSIPPSQEVLIQKNTRDTIQSEIDYNRKKIDELKELAKMSAEFDKLKNLKKIKDLKEENNLKQQEHEEKMDDKRNQKTLAEFEFTETCKRIRQEFAETNKHRETDEAEKKMADLQRFNDLNLRKEEQSKRYKILLSEIFDKHKKLVTEMKSAHKMKKDQLKLEKETLNAEIESMTTQHRIVREKVENDSWDYIEQLKEKQSQQLALEVDRGMKQKSELSLIMTNFKKRKSEQKASELALELMNKRLNDEINQCKTVQAQIANQQTDLEERGKTIKDKKNRISSLKRKTQELEKFKFVLDYKIKELKREIKPKSGEIEVLNEQVTKMRQEVKHFDRVNKNLSLIVEDLKMRQSGLKSQSDQLKATMSAQKSLMEKFREDTKFQIMQNLEDYKKLKEGVNKIYKLYSLEDKSEEVVSDDDVSKTTKATATVASAKGVKDPKKKSKKGASKSNDGDIFRVHFVNREHLEEALKQQRDSIMKNKAFHRSQYSKIMKENVHLLQELNFLTKEYQTMHRQLLANKQASPQDIKKELQDKLKLEMFQIQQLERELALIRQQSQQYAEQQNSYQDQLRQEEEASYQQSMVVDQRSEVAEQ